MPTDQHEIRIVPASLEYLDSFRDCLDSVARERHWLMTLEAHPLDEVREYWTSVIADGGVAFYALDAEQVVGWIDIMPDTRRRHPPPWPIGDGHPLRLSRPRHWLSADESRHRARETKRTDASRFDGVCLQYRGDRFVPKIRFCRRRPDDQRPLSRRPFRRRHLHGTDFPGKPAART